MNFMLPMYEKYFDIQFWFVTIFCVPDRSEH